MMRGASGPSQKPPAATTPSAAKPTTTVDLSSEPAGAERPPKASGSAARALRNQSVNQGLQAKRNARALIMRQHGGAVGEAALPREAGGVAWQGSDTLYDAQDNDPVEVRNPTYGHEPPTSAVDQTQNEPTTSRAVDMLTGSDLVRDNEEANATIDTEARGMFRAAERTAGWQGFGAYLKSFGLWGLAARAASVGTAAATKNPVVKGAVNTLAPLTMPLFHGAAGNDSKPGEEGTKFVKTADAQKLPSNALGNAFRPFMGGLSVGNTVMSGVVDGATAGAVEDGARAPTSKGSAAIQGIAKNLLFFVPGMMSGIHTARNVFATQANAGMSLQEPARNMAGDQIGVIITHQAPIKQEDGSHEIGRIKIDVDGVRHGVAILRNGGDVRFRPLGDNDVVVPETRTLGQRVGDYFRNTDPMNSASATKIGALASTMAVSSTVSHSLGPLVKSTMEARGYDPATADSAAKLATTAASSVLLGLDFIPKFMTFDHPTTPADASPPAARTPQEQRAIRTDAVSTNAVSKVAQSLIPGIGGAIALATGRANPSAAPRLNGSETKNRFATLAENKAGMLAELYQKSPGTVTRADDGTLRFDANRMKTFISEQQREQV